MEEINLFKEIIVWREIDKNTFYRYRGFQNLKTNKFCFIHCEHIYSHNFDNLTTRKRQEYDFRQLIFNYGLNNISESKMFDSLENAILDFEG